MDIDGSVFAFKLYEMEEQYGKLQCRVRICEEGSRDKIHSELKRAEDEYEESTMLLREKAKSCRSRAVAKLSQAQLDYRQKVEELKKQIKDDLHSEDSSAEDDEREAGMLYAEFAMDFATLAMQQALISVLNALDKEKKAETAATEGGRREQEADPPGLKEKEAVYMEGENEECRK